MYPYTGMSRDPWALHDLHLHPDPTGHLYVNWCLLDFHMNSHPGMTPVWKQTPAWSPSLPWPLHDFHMLPWPQHDPFMYPDPCM